MNITLRWTLSYTPGVTRKDKTELPDFIAIRFCLIYYSFHSLIRLSFCLGDIYMYIWLASLA